VFAETHGAEMVEPGEFLIYWATDLDNHECPGVSTLVQAMHVSMTAVVPYWNLPRIPPQYAE